MANPPWGQQGGPAPGWGPAGGHGAPPQTHSWAPPQGPPPPPPPPGGTLPPPGGGGTAPEPPPDLSERLAALRDGLAKRFPRAARGLRRAFNVLAWAALPLIVLNLLFIPESRQALPVYLGVFTLAIQLGLLLRSRGVGLASYFSMVAASALFAPVIYGVQVIVMAAFG